MLVLYRFSTYPEVPNLNWSLDLIQGPRDYESPALTTELMARRGTKKYLIQYNILEIFIQWEVKISKTAICFT